MDVNSSLVRFDERNLVVSDYIFLVLWLILPHSIFLRLILHFDLKKFRPNEVSRVKISLACVFAFMAIGWPLIIFKAGIAGWIKFWLMPFLGYHFWVTLLPNPLFCVNFYCRHSVHLLCRVSVIVDELKFVDEYFHYGASHSSAYTF